MNHLLSFERNGEKGTQVGRCSCGQWSFAAHLGVFYEDRIRHAHGTHRVMEGFTDGK